jgi:menaquinone-dependent protoporphyrinogen oxidase
MSRILIAYATKQGSTINIAQAIADELMDDDFQVDVCHISSVNSVDDYDAVVIGSPIRGGRWLPEAQGFVEIHRDSLLARPVALFSSCMTVIDDTPENRYTALAYLAPIRAKIEPIAVGIFAGVINQDELPRHERWLMKLRHAPEGDFRDWEEICAWAQDLKGKLVKY